MSPDFNDCNKTLRLHSDSGDVMAASMSGIGGCAEKLDDNDDMFTLSEILLWHVATVSVLY